MKQNKWLDITASEVMDSVNARNLIMTSIESILFALPNDPESVLCVGIGDGTEIEEWKRISPLVEGVEINDTSYGIVTSKGHTVHKLDMHDLSSMEKKYELIFSRDVFEHSISHIQVIEQLSNVSSRFVAITLPDMSWADSPGHYIIPTLEQMISLGMKVNLSLRYYRQIPILSGTRLITQFIYLFEKHD